MHGGKSPQAIAAGKARKIEGEIRETLGRLQVVPVGDPLTELQRFAGEVIAWKDLAAGHVAKLKAMRYSAEAGEHIRGEIIVFERALDRVGQLLVNIARLNIDERLARVSERQVEAFETALTRALTERGMSREQQREVKVDVARHLRVIAS